jgi:hypothetical protein
MMTINSTSMTLFDNAVSSMLAISMFISRKIALAVKSIVIDLQQRKLKLNYANIEKASAKCGGC